MKHLITLLLTTICCISAVAYTVLGNSITVTRTVVVNHIYYDCYTYNGNNVAAAYSFDKLTAPTELDIPATVTYSGKDYTVIEIADKAFQNYQYSDYIRAATIANTVRRIGIGAFAYARNMSRVTMGSGVQTIGQEAFNGCTELASLQMGANVETIGSMAFQACVNLKHIDLPSTIKNIGSLAFAKTKGLKSIEWDLGVNNFDYDNLNMNGVFIDVPKTVLVHTKTIGQAEFARQFFDYVYCDKEVDYGKNYKLYSSVYNTFSNENRLTTDHYKNSRNGDVNEDGKVNSADVVSIYNRIINGSVNSYEGHEYVDMGLESGTLWATCNLGASVPEEVGDYFAWGENPLSSYKYSTLWKKYGFTEDSYFHQNNDVVDNMSSGDLDRSYTPMNGIYFDWGGKWNMPTYSQAFELASACTVSDVVVNGVKCLELVSNNNGNKLYLPKGGKIDGYETIDKEKAYYWSGTTVGKDNAIVMPLDGVIRWYSRYLGLPIRPVVEKSALEQ